MTTRTEKLKARPHSDTVRRLGTGRSILKRGPLTVPVPPFVETAAYASLPAKVHHDNCPQHPAHLGRSWASGKTCSCDVQHEAKKVVDTTTAGEVSLQNQEDSQPVANPANQEKMMTLSLKGLSKNGKQAFYSGAAQVVRISVGAFPGKTAPQSIPVPDGVFEGPKQPVAKMTAEERKAARANRPKPTLAEKIASREAALAKLRAQAAGAEASM